MAEKMGTTQTPNLYDALQQGEAVDKKVDEIPGLQDSRRELESTLLSDKYRYSPQIPVIRECLKEAFGDYLPFIRVTNRFLLELEDLIEADNAFKNFKGEKVGDNWKRVDTDHRVTRTDIKSYFIEYGREMFDKLETENPGKSLEDVTAMGGVMVERLIDLVLQKVQYVEKK